MNLFGVMIFDEGAKIFGQINMIIFIGIKKIRNLHLILMNLIEFLIREIFINIGETKIRKRNEKHQQILGL